MSDFLNSFFGPLTKNSCIYFLFLSVFFFTGLILLFFVEIIYIIKNYKQLSFRNFLHGFLIAFNLLIGYFVNRLLYTMCSKTLA